ncbi:MAG: hypothetical protein EZS28_040222, partial [Streblomastix strix]
KITDPGNLDRNVDQTWRLHSYPNLHWRSVLNLIIKRISDSVRSQGAKQKARLSLIQCQVAYRQKHNAVLRVMKIQDNDQTYKETKVTLNLGEIPKSMETNQRRLLDRNGSTTCMDYRIQFKPVITEIWTEYGKQRLSWREQVLGRIVLGTEIRSTGGKRMQILDCRELNAAIKPAHFQMENINTAMQLIQRGDKSTNQDMEKAQHHVRVSQELQKYFSFHFRGKSYSYVRLSFGWNRSPMVFCRDMKQAVRAIRERWKVRGIQYIDDILLLSQNKVQLQTDTLEIMKFVEQPGRKIS